jgi:hypothetical protein
MQAETNSDETQLDRDLAAAKRRVREKRAQAGDTSPPSEAAATTAASAPAAAGEKKQGRRLSAEARADRDRAAAEKRAQAKAERLRLREQRAQERLDGQPIPHLSKVLKAADRLPELSDAANQHYEALVNDLPPGDLNALGLHLQHQYRHHVTEAAAARRLVVGQRVRLLGGPARTLGKVGTVVGLNRIRCYVEVDGVAGSSYVFTSETEDVVDALGHRVHEPSPVEDAAGAAPAEETIDAESLGTSSP